jgi:hypothetical protein
MSATPRWAGTRCLRWLFLASALLAANGLPARAQETPKPDDRNKFETFRRGDAAAGDAASKELFDKFARYFVGRLNDPEWQKGADPLKSMSALVQSLDRHFLVQSTTLPAWNQYYARLIPNQKLFVDEFGKVMIAALERPALSGKPIVRVNAARMVAEVAHSGYDGAAELCLKILGKPEEGDAVRESARFYALQGLYYLFAIVPDPIAPAKTVFQKKNAAQLPELERRSIKALIDYIQRKPPENPDVTPEALQYIRREAVRALGHVRVQSVKNGSAIESRPALVLLRVAQGQGLTPPPSASERIEAVVGFCKLLPDRDRELQVDYAAFYVGSALADIAQYYNENPDRLPNIQSALPWKKAAADLQDALQTWQKNVEDSKLPNAGLVGQLFNTADASVMQLLAAGNQGSPPNPVTLRTWAESNKPSSPSLFKSDPSTTVTPAK